MKSGRQKIKKIKKLNKIYGFACAVLIAVCFAFSTANFAYADNDVEIYYNPVSVQYFYESIGNGNPNAITVLGSQRYYLDFSLTFLWAENINVSNINADFQYYGTATYSMPDILYQINGASGIFGLDVLAVETSDPHVGVEYAAPSVVSGTTSQFRSNIYHVYHNFETGELGGGNYSVTFKYRIYYATSNPLNLVTRINTFTTPTVTGQIIEVKNPALTVLDIKDQLEYLENIDSTLYDILDELQNLDTTNNIVDMLQVDDEVIDIAESQANIIDNINSDVDVAIASAAPDAVQEISAVGTMMEGHSTFWSAQQNAVTFWKDALNYAFDFSVVSYLATGLSIVLIIILFIFVLRL